MNFTKELFAIRSENRQRTNEWFFKTGVGEYGYGDKFIGNSVPQVRKLVGELLKENCKNKRSKSGSKENINNIEANNIDFFIKTFEDNIKSEWHEVRLAALIMLVDVSKIIRKEKNFSEIEKEKYLEKIFKVYLKNTKYINNWDLVDTSAKDIVGEYLIGKEKDILYKLVKSKNLWERRISVIATFAFIKNKSGEEKYVQTFNLCEELLKSKNFENKKEDLMHKACGWMLREVGKNYGLSILNQFLDLHASKMPRTMLRYALEKHVGFAKNKYMKMNKVK